MSFYTSLTGLNAATTELSVTSNNIANAGTQGFKRSDAAFGDIFSSTPLQRADSVTGSGVALRGIVQEHSQGNVEFSTNALDLAVVGDGYFKLKTSDGAEIYTRNGGFMLNDQNQIVNSAGQTVQVLPVDSINNANFEVATTGLTVPRSTVGEFKPTTEISLGLNLPSSAEPITVKFNPAKPETYHKTTSFTTYGANGKAQLATIYYVKTSNPSEESPFSKWQTYVTIDGENIDAALTQAAGPGNDKFFINKFGEIKTKSELDELAKTSGDGAKYIVTAGTTYRKYSLDNLQAMTPSQPAAAEINIPTSSSYRDGLNLTNGSAGVDFTSAEFTGATLDKMFSIEVDGSIPRDISLTRLMPNSVLGDKVLTGKEIAQELTNEINRAFGDGKPFDLTGAATDAADPGRLVIKRTNAAGVTTNLNLDLGTILDTEDARAGSPSLRLSGTGATNDVAADGWQIAYALTEHFNQIGAGWSDIDVEYDYANQGFVFHQSGAVPDTIRVASLGVASNKLFSAAIGANNANITAADGGSVLSPLTLDGSKQLLAGVLGNGTALAQASRRSGIVVEYGGGVFTFKSGTTGDASSIKIQAKNDGADPPVFTAAGTLAGNLFGFKTTGALADVAIETEAALSLVDNIPTVRGQISSPAVLTGAAMGVDTTQAFNVTAANRTVTAVIDGVTQSVKLDIGQYNIDTFIEHMQDKLNLMADSNGKTVSNVTVGFDAEKTALVVTGATKTSRSFIQLIGSQDWGLEDVPVAFGKTSTYAKIDSDKLAGSNLFVRQDASTGRWSESVDPADFDANDLPYWTPIFLDRGEISFDTSGALVSPLDTYELESEIATGTTVSISYKGSTQYNAAFAAISQSQNGRPEGDLNGIAIAEDGLISASYSNGTQKSLGKIIIANFANSSGLRQIGDSSWTATADSGEARLGEPGAAGYGTIRGGSRERSNVDLTNELVDLISAQRNFQANAKAIETNSAMTSAIINIRN